jgi:hypothetical protein
MAAETKSALRFASRLTPASDVREGQHAGAGGIGAIDIFGPE